MSVGAAAREVVAVCPGGRLAVWGQHHPRARPPQRFQSVFTGTWRRGAASGAAAAFLLLFLSSSSGLGLRLSPGSPTAPALPPAAPATFCGSRSGWPRPGPGLEERGPPGPCGHTSRCWEAPGARFVPPVPFRGEKQRSAWFWASLGSCNTDFSPWFFVLFETRCRWCRTRLAVFSFLSFGQNLFCLYM